MPRAILAPQASATAHEIFSGIQGEGVLVGVRQIFVRFHGCHLACRYCDTPASYGDAPAQCRAEEQAGARSMAALPNPLDVSEIVGAVCRLQEGYPHHSVSLTGGEPLLHRPFLDALIPALHAAGLPTYLETNGLCPEAMAALGATPHYIAMDLKLPSAAGIAEPWDAHARFVAAAAEHVTRQPVPGLDLPTRIQAKVVFGEDSLADIARAVDLLAAYPHIPCVLQPLTPHPGGPTAPTAATVLEAQRLAAARLACVRVIPQTHVMLGQW